MEGFNEMLREWYPLLSLIGLLLIVLSVAKVQDAIAITTNKRMEQTDLVMEKIDELRVELGQISYDLQNQTTYNPERMREIESFKKEVY